MGFLKYAATLLFASIFAIGSTDSSQARERTSGSKYKNPIHSSSSFRTESKPRTVRYYRKSPRIGRFQRQLHHYHGHDLRGHKVRSKAVYKSRYRSGKHHRLKHRKPVIGRVVRQRNFYKYNPYRSRIHKRIHRNLRHRRKATPGWAYKKFRTTIGRKHKVSPWRSRLHAGKTTRLRDRRY